MDEVRVAFGKWGGRPHWEYDARLLGRDEHGAWLGLPVGTEISRPDNAFRTSEPQVVLVPEDRGFVATFYAPGGVSYCDLYVDISTVPVVTAGRVDVVDLDLDVVRSWDGEVWVDDEDEFADHRVRFGYPGDVVDLAVSTCEEVRRAVLAGVEPFTGNAPNRWLEALRTAMMGS